MRLKRERERATETDHQAWIACATIGVLVCLLPGPARAQGVGIERHWLSSDQTSTLPTLLFGSGVVEVSSASGGVASGGGTVSWVQYFERADDLGMWHVYYRQEYSHPQVGRAAPIAGTSLALHYGPQGYLYRANLAQVTDVPPLPQPTLTTPAHAFAAAQAGLAHWPGFAPGSPSSWGPGAMASILDHSRLSLAVLPDNGGHRWQWSVPTADAHGREWRALVDAVTGAVLRVAPSNPSSSYVCSPDTGSDPPGTNGSAKAVAENSTGVPELRDVWARSCPECDYDAGDPCGVGTPCTHEAVAAGGGSVPQIEVYHGVPTSVWRRCEVDGVEGNFMRIGLKVDDVLGMPKYDQYGTVGGRKWKLDDLYRSFAGDAMYHTRRTMEVFSALGPSWCGVEGACVKPARVVVDAQGGLPSEFRWESTIELYAPEDAVSFNKEDGVRSRSSALDIVAHEWSHAVSKHSAVNFTLLCTAYDFGEACQMGEGFADVMGHIVEWKVHTTEGPGYETYDWIAGEDWNPASTELRRAHEFSSQLCPAFHYSVHTSDDTCEDNSDYDVHATGNRLAVVLKLMTVGGTNPGYGNPHCPGCPGLYVTPLDSDPATSLEEAARIMWRVLTVEADQSSTDWDYLPFYAHAAVKDLYPPLSSECEAAQTTVRDAFLAVGYPETLPLPGIGCPPPMPCPPACDE